MKKKLSQNGHTLTTYLGLMEPSPFTISGPTGSVQLSYDETKTLFESLLTHMNAVARQYQITYKKEVKNETEKLLPISSTPFSMRK